MLAHIQIPYKYLDTFVKYISCKCWSKCCQILNAVICQFHLSAGDSEMLSLDDTINSFEAGSTFLPCCKSDKNSADDPVPLINDIFES